MPKVKLFALIGGPLFVLWGWWFFSTNNEGIECSKARPEGTLEMVSYTRRFPSLTAHIGGSLAYAGFRLVEPNGAKSWLVKDEDYSTLIERRQWACGLSVIQGEQGLLYPFRSKGTFGHDSNRATESMFVRNGGAWRLRNVVLPSEPVDSGDQRNYYYRGSILGDWRITSAKWVGQKTIVVTQHSMLASEFREIEERKPTPGYLLGRHEAIINVVNPELPRYQGSDPESNEYILKHLKPSFRRTLESLDGGKTWSQTSLFHIDSKGQESVPVLVSRTISDARAGKPLN